VPVTRVRLAPAPLAGHLALGTPWVPLLAGCCAGTGLSLAMDFTARTQDPRLVATLVRASFVPVLAGLAFVLQDRHWLLSASLPVPGWIATAMRAGLVLPFLAVTCWLQLSLADRTLAKIRAGGTLPALAIGAEFAGACAITLAAAAVVQRSRWHDLGGALALPLAFIVLAALAFGPLRPLPTQIMTTGTWPQGWVRTTVLAAVLAVVAAAATAWSGRDRWRRLGPVARPRRQRGKHR
jgi:hypothetical protein